MIAMVLSYLGSAAGGAITKGFFGLLQEFFQGNREREQGLISIAAKREGLHVEKFNQADNYTKHTRRILAWWVFFIYGIILLLWAVFPQAEIATFILPSEGGETANRGLTLFGYSLVGVENPTNLAKQVIKVTSGHLVIANSYVLAYILGAYFMPTGRK
jgi:hypothetical protein